MPGLTSITFGTTAQMTVEYAIWEHGRPNYANSNILTITLCGNFTCGSRNKLNLSTGLDPRSPGGHTTSFCSPPDGLRLCPPSSKTLYSMLFFRSLITLGAFALVAKAAIAPRQSGGPCTYTCPSEDKDGRDLRSSSTTGNNLRCNYSSNGDRNCRYNRTTGSLSQDNDEGDCPARAVGSPSCPTKRALESRKQFEARSIKRGKPLADDDRAKLERRKNLRIARGVRLVGR